MNLSNLNVTELSHAEKVDTKGGSFLLFCVGVVVILCLAVGAIGTAIAKAAKAKQNAQLKAIDEACR